MIKKIKIPFLINKGIKLIGSFILEDENQNVIFLKKEINDYGVYVSNINDEYILLFNHKKIAKLACSYIGRQIKEKNILKIDWIDSYCEGDSLCF